MASTRKSVVFRAGWKSSMNGTERFWSWVLSRCVRVRFGSWFLLLELFSCLGGCVLGRARFCPVLGSTPTACSQSGLGVERLRGHLPLVIC